MAALGLVELVIGLIGLVLGLAPLVLAIWALVTASGLRKDVDVLERRVARLEGGAPSPPA